MHKPRPWLACKKKLDLNPTAQQAKRIRDLGKTQAQNLVATETGA